MYRNAAEPLSPFMSASNGHLGYHLIREADPDGRAVEHRLVTTHRLIDQMLQAGQLTPLRHEAATRLRDDYEQARPKLADASARALDGPLGAGGDSDLVADEAAWKRYCGAMRAADPYWANIRWTAIEDRSAESWRHPWDFGKHKSSAICLELGLDRLITYYGLA